jgi:hypothetical protein
MWEKTVIQDPLPLTVSSMEISESPAQLARGGECIRRSFTRRMLGDDKDTINMAAIVFEEGYQTLVFRD